jgi:hypothetical protein
MIQLKKNDPVDVGILDFSRKICLLSNLNALNIKLKRKVSLLLFLSDTSKGRRLGKGI